MAYFDNGNYNFDDLFNELNRDFFNDGRMTNGQQPMRYSAGQAPQQGAQNGQQQKEKPIGVDLTEQAKKGKYDPVIGRTAVIDQVIEILSRRKKNNPVLTGPAGVGKTSVVEGLAQRIVDGDVPEKLKNAHIIELNINELVAGTSLRGSFEEKLKNLKQKRLNIDFECSNLSDKVTEVQENCKKLEIDYASLISKKEGLVNSFNVYKSNEEKNNIELQKVSDDLKNIEEKIKVFSEKDISANSLKNTADDGKLKYWTEKEEKVKSSISSIQVDLAKLQEAIHFNQKMKTERENYSILQKNERTELNQEIAETVEKEKNISKELVQMEELFKTNQKNYEDSKIIQNNLQEKYDIFEQEQKTNDVEWRKIQEESVKLQSKITERKIRLENFKEQELQVVEFFKENNLTVENAEKLRVEGNMQSISGKKIEIERKISELGSVNPNGVEEYEMQLRRREFYETQIHDLVKAKEGLQTVIEDIEKKMEKEFKDAFSLINKEFNRIMNLMFDGGKARLELTDEKSPLDGGVEIYLQLPGKKRQSLTLMSGGERALTVIALLISFMAYKPAPFCFVDEIDASLDDANVARYSSMIADYKKKTQFIVISHRKKTMEYADTLQGVTMGEKGVSSLITVHMKDYIKENNNELF